MQRLQTLCPLTAVAQLERGVINFCHYIRSNEANQGFSTADRKERIVRDVIPDQLVVLVDVATLR